MENRENTNRTPVRREQEPKRWRLEKLEERIAPVVSRTKTGSGGTGVAISVDG